MTSRNLMHRGKIAIAILAAFAMAACSEPPTPPQLQAFGAVANNESEGTPYDASVITADQLVEPEWDSPVAALADASAVELVLNGSFEASGPVGSTAFANWTVVSGTGGNSFYVDDGGTSPFSGFPVPPVPHGIRTAMADQGGPGNSAIYQDIAVPANLCKPLRLSFLEWHGNRANVWIGSDLNPVNAPKQHLRVDVMKPAAPIYDVGAGVIQAIYLSQAPDPFVRPGYVPMTATLPTTLGGSTIRLRFAQVNNQLWLQVGIDNVSLQAEPDVTAPVISLAVDPSVSWPPNHKMVKVASNVSATDDCGMASFSVTVTSNESANGRGDGNTTPDHQVVPNGSGGFDVYVRSERSGTGGGRVYTITAKATDTTGNTSTAQATVAVPHNK